MPRKYIVVNVVCSYITSVHCFVGFIIFLQTVWFIVYPHCRGYTIYFIHIVKVTAYYGINVSQEFWTFVAVTSSYPDLLHGL